MWGVCWRIRSILRFFLVTLFFFFSFFLRSSFVDLLTFSSSLLLRACWCIRSIHSFFYVTFFFFFYALHLSLHLLFRFQVYISVWIYLLLLFLFYVSVCHSFFICWPRCFVLTHIASFSLYTSVIHVTFLPILLTSFFSFALSSIYLLSTPRHHSFVFL